MDCPLCLTWRSKKFWSDGQWHAGRAIAHGIIGCKDCRDNPKPPLDVLSEKRALMHEFAEHLQKGRKCAWWASWIWDWMHGLSARYRKQASHFGAVRCFDETHYPPDERFRVLGKECFDPGNWVYTMVLILLVPTITNKNWTEETMGDIVEAMLATGMRPCSGPAARAVALWLEKASGLLYTIVCWFPFLRTKHDIEFLIGYVQRHLPATPLDLNSMD